jgi:sterol desaturase/sphingolipid hydroxylase (fatty acid hydroxylase superfamily)
MENNMNAPDAPAPDLEEQNTRATGRGTITFLVVTAFLNMMGAAILAPVLPFIAQCSSSNLQSLATVVWWLVAVYALCQFIRPAWFHRINHKKPSLDPPFLQ